VVDVTSAVVADDGADIFGDAGEVGEELFGGLFAEVGILFDGSVEVGDVGLVMLVVMEFHGRFIDGGLESGVVIGKGRKFESHGITPLLFYR
jgi:hypothetical protein